MAADPRRPFLRGSFPALLVFLLSIALAPLAARAQQIAIDQGVRAGGLWCFPLVTDPRTYVYLPAAARLAEDDDGKPQFSFVRYVVNEPGADAGAASITGARGGGVLHFLVLYDTPADLIAQAEQTLRKSLKDDEVRVRGPVVFADGRYALVSSIVSPTGGPPERRLLTTGRAPVLEGNRLALSFELEPQQASLLMESFKMATPDVSLVFDMTFQGLSNAYDAELFIDWSEVRKSEAFGAGGSIYFVSADVERSFDELFRKNAIRLKSSGTDAAMEALLTNVYDKLLELMFRRVEPDRVPDAQRGGLMDAIGALIAPKGGALSSRKTTGFGLYAGFQLKEMRSAGTSTLNFNHRATVDRHSFITFNIGDFHKRFGKDPEYFRAVNLADPTFQQREIHVGIDGALLPEFEKFVNSVTVTLRKQHGNGEQTVRELVLDRAAVQRSGNDLRMVYGWNGDDDRDAWLKYEYRTRWSFKGGGSYQTEWMPGDGAMIDLFAPYERRTVQLMGSAAALQAKGVRAVVVQIDYPFFAARRRQQLVAKPDQPIDAQAVEITLPLNQFEYDVTITWQLEGNRKLTRSGKDSSGLVFVDELPEGQVSVTRTRDAGEPRRAGEE